MSFSALESAAQSIAINGNVKNSNTQENAAAVSVEVKDGTEGTFTDDKGNFRLSVKSFPVTLVFSSIGYASQEISVTSANQSINISLTPENTLGQEVVVSASRVAERIMESPVSIERVSSTAMRNAPAANYYDVVNNLKGVDVVTSSLTFKTPTTRGFAGSGNTRFNQVMDGMDNQAPGLNFSVGSVVGLPALDVESMELLPGASSVLYGPGGMNGTLLINSKNPFKYQGLSFEVKTGIMHTDGKQRDPSAYHNWSLRWGKKVSDKFAFKITSELLQAKDWIGEDYRNYNRIGNMGDVIPGDRKTDPNYDGINVFGDETSLDIGIVLNSISQQAPFLKPFIDSLTANPIRVSRTGYTEREVVNPNTYNFKLGGSLNYKLTSATELIFAGYWGTGTSVYTGNDRYDLVDLKMGQYKIELQNKKWMLRAYTTQENSGNAFAVTTTTRLFNELWRPSISMDANGNPAPLVTDWYPIYAQAFLANKLAGQSDYDAHNNARVLADQGRPEAGSQRFKTLMDEVKSKPIPKGGKFLDRTDLYQLEGQYNLTEYTKKFADVLVGANYKTYVLNSEGTLFADTAGTIKITEIGAYAQLGREFLNNKLRLTLAGRYDKNSGFKGNFTPRATALYRVKENKNIRLSYQTAYRFPTTQQQWINLYAAGARLIGGDPSFFKFFHFDTNPAYYAEDLRHGVVKEYDMKLYKPETVSSFELGYKGLHLNDRLLIDAYAYYGMYKDFLTRVAVVQNKTGAQISQRDTADGNIYSVVVNLPDKVKTFGFGIGVDYKLPYNFVASANVSSDELKDVPDGFLSFFNAPKYRFSGALANTGFGPGKRLGFNVTYRWQDGFFYQGDFASGNVPAFHVLDAMVSLKFPKSKSVFKIGANNLLNQYYYNAIGNAQAGGLYYVGFGYNLY